MCPKWEQNRLLSFRLIEDLDHTRLVGDRDEASIQMVMLALTGRALHYFHNGNIEFDINGNLMVS